MVVTLAQALDRLGHDVGLATIRNEQRPNTDAADRARAAGVRTEVIPCAGRLDLRTIGRIKDVMKRFGPDVVHTHGYKADIYALIAGVRSRAALVATCHNWTDCSAAVRL